MSSTIRTPWPRRSAPHHWSASQIDGSPNDSPAWIVMWKFSRRTYSNASRWRVGRIAGLRTGDVEADDTGVPPADGTLGDLDRAGGLAHRGDEHLHDDRAAGRRGPLGPDLEALEVRGHDLVERQAALRRQLGRVADLGVDDPVGRQVLGAFGRHPDDRVTFLHDADGMGERLEVQLEALAVGAAPDVRRERVRVARRQPVVAELGRQVDDGRRAQAPVEMVMEQRLGRLADRVGREHLPGMVQGSGLRDRHSPLTSHRERATISGTP